MTKYREYSQLHGKTLAEEDEVIFKTPEKRMEHVVHDSYLNNEEGPNNEVFKYLGLDAMEFATEHYGYAPTTGDWPESNDEDFQALTRLVLALFAIIEKKKPIEKEKDAKIGVFKPGMSVDEYVDGELKTAKDERKKWLEIYRRCILPDRVRKELEAAITVVLRRDIFEKWGLHEHFEKGITNSILLYGPPGTGKTMVSESIAAILGKNLMTASSGDIQSSIPGETERNVKRIFKKATDENCVLLMDECDSILGDRNNVGHIMAAEINALLTEIERFDGVVILTTNRLHHLDPALQRRIVAKVRLENPTQEARIDIWKSSLPPKMPLHKDVEVLKLADIDLSGGEIKNGVLLAARMAIAEGEKKVSMRHFVSAIEGIVEAKREYQKTRPHAVNMGRHKVQG